MSSSQKGLNIKCANWRDRKKKSLSQQMGLFTYCMQQDCEQSMEKVGCRYTDENNFCYTDSGQNFCKQNAGHSKCNDLGAAAQPSNKDGKGAWAPVTDGITYDTKGALQKSEPHFHCACYKGCVFSSSSKAMEVKCDTDGGAPFKVLFSFVSVSCISLTLRSFAACLQCQLILIPAQVGKLAGTPLGRSDIVVKRLNKKKSCACICCFSSNGDCYNAVRFSASIACALLSPSSLSLSLSMKSCKDRAGLATVGFRGQECLRFTPLALGFYQHGFVV